MKAEPVTEVAPETTTSPEERLRSHLASVPRRDPDGPAVYFHEQITSWRDLDAAASALGDALGSCGLTHGAAVGWVARNDPAIVASALGILRSSFFLTVFNPHDPTAKLAGEVRELRPSAVVGMAADWSDELKDAVAAIGAVGLTIDLSSPSPVTFVPGLDKLGQGPFRENPEGAVLERMSSGTTGAPKRVPVTADVLHSAMVSGLGPTVAQAPGKRLSPQITTNPFAHSSGTWGLAMMLYSGRPMALLDRFDAAEWVKVVRRFKPRVVSLVPTMISMLMDLKPAPEDLASIICVRSGTAPLDRLLKRDFEKAYGIPILIDYGATEFIGGVAGWSLEDHRAFGQSKNGSVGRIRADIEVRIVDHDDDRILGAGEIGVLCLKSPRFGDEWVRTTDLASYDEDRFLYIHGRSDEAIIRGGFKVLPERVAEVLRLHPAVKDACILAVSDQRLGQIPLAVVEVDTIDESLADELRAVARENMPAYQVPAMFEFVRTLPRTNSMKVARPAVRELFRHKYNF